MEGNELNYINYSKHKRSVVFSRFCLFVGLAAMGEAILGYFSGLPYITTIDIFFAFILLLGYYLNYRGHQHIAKVFTLTFSNIMLFLAASVLPKEFGVYLFFFPLFIFSFIIFDYERRGFSIGISILSLILIIILLTTSFQPFGSIDHLQRAPSIAFGLNLFLSFLLMSLAIHFILTINHTTQQILLGQKDKTDLLSKEVYEKNLSLQKTNEELDSFVYSTSHDLKAPIASIKGLLNLVVLENETISPTISSYLKMMDERVDSLNMFIKDILDYSRNSRLDVVAEPVNISKLIDEVVLTNKYLENTNKIKINIKVETSLVFNVDKNRLMRVLTNLVSNAIKYSDLTKENPFITIKITAKENLLILIEDNGIGISEENKLRVFEMFYRGTELADGSGLGLYIAQEIIHKMKGTLNFESKLGKGSTFSVLVPLV